MRPNEKYSNRFVGRILSVVLILIQCSLRAETNTKSPRNSVWQSLSWKIEGAVPGELILHDEKETSQRLSGKFVLERGTPKALRRLLSGGGEIIEGVIAGGLFAGFGIGSGQLSILPGAEVLGPVSGCLAGICAIGFGVVKALEKFSSPRTVDRVYFQQDNGRIFDLYFSKITPWESVVISFLFGWTPRVRTVVGETSSQFRPVLVDRMDVEVDVNRLVLDVSGRAVTRDRGPKSFSLRDFRALTQAELDCYQSFKTLR